MTPVSPPYFGMTNCPSHVIQYATDIPKRKNSGFPARLYSWKRFSLLLTGGNYKGVGCKVYIRVRPKKIF